LTAGEQDQCSLSAAGSLLATKPKRIDRIMETADWFSASKAYVPSQKPNCGPAMGAKAGYFQQEIDFDRSPPLPSFLRYCATNSDER
jgi:hypothetical protein